MIKNEIRMHLAYGKYAGEASTCGYANIWKQAFGTEEAAVKAASSLNKSPKRRHEVEAYPCYWCSNLDDDGCHTVDVVELSWHIGRKLTDRERAVFSLHGFIDMEVIEIGYADPIFGAESIQELKVHNRLLCQGDYCCVHNPSNHPLKNAPLNWRADRGMMERICSHGVGHPDPDDMLFKKTNNIPYDSIHGCDWCCVGGF